MSYSRGWSINGDRRLHSSWLHLSSEHPSCSDAPLCGRKQVGKRSESFLQTDLHQRSAGSRSTEWVSLPKNTTTDSLTGSTCYSVPLRPSILVLSGVVQSRSLRSFTPPLQLQRIRNPLTLQILLRDLGYMPNPGCTRVKVPNTGVNHDCISKPVGPFVSTSNRVL